MKGYAIVIGPKRKVLAISKQAFECSHEAAAMLDYEAIAGLTGTHHNAARVLKEHGATLVRIDFRLVPAPADNQNGRTD